MKKRRLEHNEQEAQWKRFSKVINENGQWRLCQPLAHPPIICAIISPESDLLHFLLSLPKFDINTSCYKGINPLEYALLRRKITSVEKIIRAGGKVHFTYFLWLQAIAMNNWALLKTLVEGSCWNAFYVNNTQCGDTAVHWAIEFGRFDMLQYIVEEKQLDTLSHSNSKRWTPAYLAIKYNRPKILEWIIMKQRGKIGPMSTTETESVTMVWEMGSDKWAQKTVIAFVSPFDGNSIDCLKLALRCPDCDNHSYPYRRLWPRVIKNMNGWDIGDAACRLLSSIPPDKSDDKIVIDISNNPRIGNVGLKAICVQMICVNDVHEPFVGTMIFSHIPPRWIYELRKLSEEHKTTTIKFEFPSLYTICLWWHADRFYNSYSIYKRDTCPIPEIKKRYNKLIPSGVLQNLQDIIVQT